MADTIRSNSSNDAAEPPGGGRQDHETMRAAAMRTVRGPASTDTLAAGGGLDVPGREAPPSPSPSATAEQAAAGGQAPHEPIPGERDATTLTHREPGAMGGQFAGADIPSAPVKGWMDDRTAYEHAREGGGDAVKKRKP